MLYTLPGQVRAIAPFNISGNRSVDLLAEFNRRLSNPVTLEVQPSAPGILSMDATGKGLGAILDEDYSSNGTTSPSRRGGVIILHATGAGQNNPGTVAGF